MPTVVYGGYPYNTVPYNGTLYELSSVTIIPASPIISTTDTQQFIAKVYDITGKRVVYGLTFHWSVDSGGTIDNNGLFTPSGIEGIFNVTVVVRRQEEVLTTSTTVEVQVALALEITQPTEEILTGTNETTIAWIISGVDSSTIAYYNVYLSKDGGYTFEPIVIGLSPTHYDWIVPDLFVPSAVIKVNAYNFSNEFVISDERSYVIYPLLTGSVTINNGASTTTSLFVTLQLYVRGAAPFEMLVSNDPTFGDTDWESYTVSKSWIFTGGVGVKTVYVRYRDLTGRETITYTASIGYIVIAKSQGLQGYGALFHRTKGSALGYPAVSNFPLDQGTIECWTGTEWNGDDGLVHYVFDHAPRNDRYKNRICLYKDSQGMLVFEIHDRNRKIYRTMTDITRIIQTERHILKAGDISVKLNAVPAYSSLDLNQDEIKDLFISHDTYFMIYKVGSLNVELVQPKDYDAASGYLEIEPILEDGIYEFNYIANWTRVDGINHHLAVSYYLRPPWKMSPDPILGPDVILDSAQDLGVYYFRLYIDGKRKTSGALGSLGFNSTPDNGYIPVVPQPIILDESAKIFYVGCDTAEVNQWDGMIKEFRILSVASGDQDVMEDYQIGKAGYEFINTDKELESRRNMVNNTLMLMHYDRVVNSEPGIGKLSE